MDNKQQEPRRILTSSSRSDNQSSLFTESFSVSFTCLSIILLAVFVYLNSLASPDIPRQEVVLDSLKKQFKPLSGTAMRTSSNDLNTTYSFPQGLRLRLFKRISELPAWAYSKGQLELITTDYGLVLRASTAGLFWGEDDQIRAEYLPLLQHIANEAKHLGLLVDVQAVGGSDIPKNGSLAPTPTEIPQASNLKLALSRAMSLYRFFLDSDIKAVKLSAGASGGLPGSGQHRPGINEKTIVLTMTKAPIAADRKKS